ncbi:hypothetical protein TNCT_435411 [Trichonephila clavata]|uniref:Uncharacterized protein n=1 Tax=Trichonephila clavata TaxID=2740835 RepID=A0A8X6GRD3_TRICU|nr:hypothetical protein TNCT_435411 [Trichonephila clavata]
MIWLVFLTSVVIGMLFKFTRCSLWRRKYCQLMPGNKPWFFDILADAKDLIVFNKSGDKYSIHHHIMKLMVERSEIYREKKIYCFWAMYFPFVFLLKPDAIQVCITFTSFLTDSYLNHYRMKKADGSMPLKKVRKNITNCSLLKEGVSKLLRDAHIVKIVI